MSVMMTPGQVVAARNSPDYASARCAARKLSTSVIRYLAKSTMHDDDVLRIACSDELRERARR